MYTYLHTWVYHGAENLMFSWKVCSAAEKILFYYFSQAKILKREKF